MDDTQEEAPASQEAQDRPPEVVCHGGFTLPSLASLGFPVRPVPDTGGSDGE